MSGSAVARRATNRFAAARRAAVTGALSASIALALSASIALALPASIALALPLASQAVVKAKAPRASTGSALHVGESTVALNATVNPSGLETTCYFQYGTTTAYDAQTPVAAVGGGATPVKVSQPMAGLQPGTTYHYRVAATNAMGTVTGQDHTFTTKRIPLRFVIAGGPKVDPFGKPFSLSGTLSGTGAADRQVMLQASAFPYLSGFADIGTPQSTNAEGAFSFSVPNLSQTTELRVRTVEPTPSYSQAATVHVAVSVTLHAHAVKGTVRLSGTVAPVAVGDPVVFQWVRPGGRFVRVASTIVRKGSASVSRFSAAVGIRHNGYYRALVQVTNGRQASGFSRSVFLRATVARKRGRARTH